jgi:Protein of unknown function (DUF2497)
MVSESVDAAFGMLAQTEQPHGGRTVEELVTELIRPMLKTWLDDNLPGLVERLVRGSASWLLVTAMRDADHMAERWGHDVAITRLAYMKRHLERNREAEIEPAARAKGLAAEQEDKVTLLRDTPAEPPRDLNPQEAEIWQATVDGMKAQDLLRDFDEFRAQVNKLDAGSAGVEAATPSGHRGRWVRSTAMDRYASRENIKRYKKLLGEVKDDPRRRLIQKLLLEEEQKEVPFQTPSPRRQRAQGISGASAKGADQQTFFGAAPLAAHGS